MRHLVLVSDATATCGVEAFARLTATHLGASAEARPLGAPLGDAEDVILNLPVVAWKKRLLAPIIAAAKARLIGRKVTVILHEWADLALARRLSYLPLLPFATRILFSSPEIMAQFESTPVSRVLAKARGIVPIPPNFTVPEWTKSTALSQSLAGARAVGTFVLGQFGSIYARKEPGQLLEAAAEMVRRGVDTRVVFVGSFIKDSTDTEGEFWAEVDRLGLTGRVDVSGYVASAEEIYGMLAEVDAFLYPLSEGLTSRRGSVQAAALSGRPVIVTAPARSDSLRHHRLLSALAASVAIQFVPRDADAAALADAVLATRGLPVRPVAAAREIAGLWGDVVGILDA